MPSLNELSGESSFLSCDPHFAAVLYFSSFWLLTVPAFVPLSVFRGVSCALGLLSPLALSTTSTLTSPAAPSQFVWSLQLLVSELCVTSNAS